ncbi:GntR family transcriptional regulator [Agrobacterium vitis]|nr:GntR family transcriptional regulator [Agrobacterium vitis]
MPEIVEITMRTEKTKTIPKAEQIYWLLRQAIVHLEMQPGAIISEKDLCAEFGVSRTPVREALQRLADEGLVDVFPHSGTYVSRISFTVAEEGFVIRRALEIESVRKAVANVTDSDVAQLKSIITQMQAILDSNELGKYLDCDDAFHSAIATISGYPRIWKFITLAKVHLDRMRQLSAPVPGHLAVVTEQHDTIVRALASRNADQAELAMRIHLDSSFAVMAKMHEDQGALFDGKEGP